MGNALKHQYKYIHNVQPYLALVKAVHGGLFPPIIIYTCVHVCMHTYILYMHWIQILLNWNVLIFCWYVTTNFMTASYTHLSTHSSVGQKSGMAWAVFSIQGLTRLESRCWCHIHWALLQRLWGKFYFHDNSCCWRSRFFMAAGLWSLILWWLSSGRALSS